MAKSQKSSVAFQGELGAFSHVAVQRFLGPGAAVQTCETFQDVFEALSEGAVTYAAIPIENTLHGSIHENYDHLLRYGFEIHGETTVKIEHHLIALPGVEFRSVKRVLSHPVALNQCRQFLRKHKRLQPVSFYDTAGSVKMLMTEQLTDSAAIASETAAQIYGAEILRRNVEDNAQNFTRFFLLSGKRTAKTSLGAKTESGVLKTSVVFSTENAPGTLFKALACFALRELNLTKLESRPQREKPWEYLFYIDFLAKATDPAAGKALDQLQEMSTFFRILGTYAPQGLGEPLVQ